MQISKINNTSFKQTFMHRRERYTDSQKRIADNIESEIDKYESLGALQNKPRGERPDFMVARLGSKDSLRVFRCKMEYNYEAFQYLMKNPLYIGKYDENNKFKSEDIDEARKHSVKNTIKAGVLFSLASMLSAFGLKKLLRKI